MGWDVVAGNALGLVSTILDFFKDNRFYKKKSQYEKLMEEIRELEEKSDEETDDNLLHHKRNELGLFLSVWATEIKSGKLAE